MLDIKEEIQLLLVKNKLSMRKLIREMNAAGYKPPAISNFSKMLIKKTIKFSVTQEILDFLGYELRIHKKP